MDEMGWDTLKKPFGMRFLVSRNPTAFIGIPGSFSENLRFLGVNNWSDESSLVSSTAHFTKANAFRVVFEMQLKKYWNKPLS